MIFNISCESTTTWVLFSIWHTRTYGATMPNLINDDNCLYLTIQECLMLLITSLFFSRVDYLSPPPRSHTPPRPVFHLWASHRNEMSVVGKMYSYWVMYRCCFAAAAALSVKLDRHRGLTKNGLK